PASAKSQGIKLEISKISLDRDRLDVVVTYSNPTDVNYVLVNTKPNLYLGEIVDVSELQNNNYPELIIVLLDSMNRILPVTPRVDFNHKQNIKPSKAKKKLPPGIDSITKLCADRKVKVRNKISFVPLEGRDIHKVMAVYLQGKNASLRVLEKKDFSNFILVNQNLYSSYRQVI
ncbi:MAG: hypothetical protein AAF620_20300, partial [Bacteroidota bacterium]